MQIYILLKVLNPEELIIVSFAYMQIYILLKDVSNFKYINQRCAYMQIYILLKGQIHKMQGIKSRLNTYKKIYFYDPFLFHRVCFRRWCCLLTSSSTLHRRKFPNQLSVQYYYFAIFSSPYVLRLSAACLCTSITFPHSHLYVF